MNTPMWKRKDRESGDRPPWADAVTEYEYGCLQESVGSVEHMTPAERVCWFLADFSLTSSHAYLSRRSVNVMDSAVYQRIMDYCFVNLGYVPMLLRNSKFTHSYEVQLKALPCPDVDLGDISSGKVLAYREKKDGGWVREATVVKGDEKIVAWVGALHSPCLIPTIKAFELVGMEAFSIRPYNAEGRIYFGEDYIEFVERPLRFSVDPQWTEGAIAFVLTPGGIVEKRIKRVCTAEVLVAAKTAVIEGREYPVLTPPGPVPVGVYECAYQRGQLIVQAFRPWRQPTADFFKAVRKPTVHSLQAIPEREVFERPGPIRCTSSTLSVPPSYRFKSIQYLLPPTVRFTFRVESKRHGAWRDMKAQVVVEDTQIKIYTTEADMLGLDQDISSQIVLTVGRYERKIFSSIVPVRLTADFLTVGAPYTLPEVFSMSEDKKGSNLLWFTTSERGMRCAISDCFATPPEPRLVYSAVRLLPQPPAEDVEPRDVDLTFTKVVEEPSMAPLVPSRFLTVEGIAKRLKTPRYPEVLWAEINTPHLRATYPQFESFMSHWAGKHWTIWEGKWRLCSPSATAGAVTLALASGPKTRAQLYDHFWEIPPDKVDEVLQGPLRLWREEKGVFISN